MKQRLKLIFYLSKKRKNQYNTHPIYCRITIAGERTEISTGIFVGIENFTKGKVCNHPQEVIHNAKLDWIVTKINALHLDLLMKNKPVTLFAIKEQLMFKAPAAKSLLQLMQIVTDEAQENPKAEKSTKYSYIIRSKNIVRFFKKHNLQNIPADSFGIEQLQKLEDYLHRVRGFNYNYTNKHLFFLGQAFKKGIELGFATKNPIQFLKFKKDEEKEIIALTKEQLIALEAHKFASPYLQRVAHLYIFQCYTGLAYIDLCAFNPAKHIHISEGRKWIKESRAKTRVEALLPLFRKAEEILNLYNYELPLISNQKYNVYLKEVAQIMGFEVKLTTHTARKTFGMVKLNEGVSIETVAKMMGHNSIKITQKTYAKVTHTRIFNEMQLLGLR